MRFYYFLLVIVILPLYTSGFIAAKSRNVCSLCEYKTIKAAIKHADSGDEIILHNEVFTENNIVIKKSLTLRGEKGAVIDANNKGTILLIKADNVKIENLIFRNVGYSNIKDYVAILVYKSNNFTIKNNYFEKVLSGIKVEKSKYGFIESNQIFSGDQEQHAIGSGINAWDCAYLIIKNNNIYGMRDGIYFEFVKDSLIENNNAYNNYRYGLHFMFSNNNAYIKNKFYKNGAGVAVMFSKFITMENNVFSENWGTASYGLLLKEIYDAEIINNAFLENTIAIHVEGSTRVNYIDNYFKSNGWAIKVAGACYKNIIKKNNFSGNAFDLSYHSNINDNEFDNNYWSDYTGYDLNKDGVGDVPYRPVKLFSYLVSKNPEAIILLRSLFVDIVNFSEKVSPIFTPDNIIDKNPAMREHE
ncbi:MAG: nitrous oxide reductase family maturation protein NosD [Spirochaetia bacterium]|nr:nitrous oxide reductase family maturation protein NosD [Spirochaetia bacterium]